MENFTEGKQKENTELKAPSISTNPVSGFQNTSLKEESRIRYSDEELQEFKDLIEGKLNAAKKDFELLKSTLCLRDDNGTNDTSPTFKQLEDAVDVLSKEETAQHAMRQEKFITHLQNALIRIENKSYGVCRVTGKLIAKERLKSVPHATTSIDAKRNLPECNI